VRKISKSGQRFIELINK